MRKWSPFIFLFLCISILNTSCGITNPAKRENGVYVGHLHSCGPIAISKALKEYGEKNQVTFKSSLQSNDISVRIQERNKVVSLRGIMTLFDKRAAEITFPKEIVAEVKSHGINIKTVRSVDEIDPKKDVAIILVHKRGTLTNYHWICFPCQSIDHYGKETVVDKIYLLIP